MKVLLLSRYDRLGASSRVRSLQYIPYLNNNGINIEVEPLFSNEYITALYSGKPRWIKVVFAYWHRLMVLVTVKKYDFIWLEKELFPFVPAGFERLLNIFKIPYIVDYDDALFHRYDQHRSWIIRKLLGYKIDVVMRHAAIVIVGNEYLAERARTAGAHRVKILPTVIDIERYSVISKRNNQPLTVGWIGSPATSRYLLDLKPVIESLKKQFDVRFVAIGARKEDLKNIPIEIWPWTEESEVSSIQLFDIGIMPLSNTPWERGKCGYKLIQYMACGLPVVASAVGVNKEIINHEKNGYLINSPEEWKQTLSLLLENSSKRTQMGQQGRLQVEKQYSMQVQSTRLLSILRSVAV
ncbi:MAG: glycosyltransferase family 4 protein [Gammaproteobacteria bacterium]|nr:glycosyltransferase family 4 protein [Gammaproteobacteria bacterium]